MTERTRAKAATPAAPAVKRGRILTPAEPQFAELEALMKEVNGRYGENVMERASNIQGYRHIETGVFMLDFALLGGMAEGFATMLYGWESSGKTTTAMRVVGNALKKFPNKAAVWLDPETTFDPIWADVHGIDRSRLYYSQPDSGEHAVDIASAVLKNSDSVLLVLDSIPALVPQKEADNSAEDDTVAMRARLVAKFCAKVLSSWHVMRPQGFRVTVIMINQWRNKIVIKGDNRSLPGGNQPRFLCSTMIETKNLEVLEADDRGVETAVHSDMSFVVKKSKAGNSLRNGSYRLIRDPAHELGAGAIDEHLAVVSMAKKMGFYTGGGSSWKLATTGDHKFGNSERAREFLVANPDEMLRLKQFLIINQRKAMGLPYVPVDRHILGKVPNDIVALAEKV
jgi:recombination protein RecA